MTNRGNSVIGAVIVTFNRAGELVKNIEQTCRQTRRLEFVLVVDNNSTDDTAAHVKDLQDKYENLHYVNTGSNTGGAGGFHAGVEWLLEHGCDYLWLMDDDGRPELNCLERLMAYTSVADVLGPLIYSDKNTAHAEHKIADGMTSDLHLLVQRETLDIVHPFNGTLVPRKIFERIGNVKKELFIWGDEQDFRFRWIRAGFTECTVTAARYFHPVNRLKIVAVMFVLKKPLIEINRKYIFYRNQAYIDLRSRFFVEGLISFLRWVISVLLLESNKKISLLGLFNGLRGDLREPHIR